MKTTILCVLALATAAQAEDNWQKMKDCAAQAEKLEKKLNGDGKDFVYSQYHYSPKYNRCYLERSWHWSPLDRESKQAYDEDELTDVYENRELADIHGTWDYTKPAGKDGLWHPQLSCFIGSYKDAQGELQLKYTDCRETRAFIDDHMKE